MRLNPKVRLGQVPQGMGDIIRALTNQLEQIALQVNGISEGSMAARHITATTTPTAGTWAVGDEVLNSNPVEIGIVPAPVFRSKTLLNFSGVATSVGVEPTGAALNDSIFYFISSFGAMSSFVPPTGGWTLLANIPGANGSSTRLYWIRRGSSAPGYTASWTGSTFGNLSITAYSGCVTTGNPYNVFAANPTNVKNPDNPDCPAVIVTVPNTTIVVFGAAQFGVVTAWGAPAGYTIREANIADGVVCVADKALATTGTEDPAPFTGGKASPSDVGEITVALMSAGGGAYIVKGWINTTGGTPGFWVQERLLTGN